jgi:catechol 2,3-dioxygenase-like lactoylglutathione lyase family enzyme
MATIDHVTFRVGDLAAGRRLYGRAFELLEFEGEPYESSGFVEWNDFSLLEAEPEEATRGAHIGFAATSRDQIDAWWQQMTAAGYQDDGAPGPRPIYTPEYYGAFIRDLEDNSLEAVRHEFTTRESGLIDHLWIRVADLDAARRFYTAAAPTLGLGIRDRGERLHLVAEGASFALLAGTPTKNLHLAVGVGDKEAVGAFHRAGLDAGGRDHGAPGERPRYHAGYYSAYLLDPDGNNIEAVFHDRP